MLRSQWVALLLSLFAAVAAAQDRTVVIISWDGGKPSVIRQLVREGKLSHTRTLLDDGSYSWAARTIVPSSTLQSHTSMVTGLTMERHGITWNDRFREEAGYVKVSTIFELAKKAGMRTALVVSKDKLKQFAKPGSLDREEYVKGDALKVAATAVQVLRTVRPHLMLVHFADPDSAGHRYGWGNEKKGIPPSSEFVEALVRCDVATGRIVAALKGLGLWDRTLVIITADHGGHNTGHGSDDPEDVHIPWIAAGGLAAKNGELNQTIRTMDTAATALAALGLKAPSHWDGKPVWSALQNGGKAAMQEQTLTIIAQWKGNYSGIEEPRRLVVTDEKTWANLWQTVHSAKIPTPLIPNVDFNRHMVVAAFMGRKPTSGYSVQITKVVARYNEVQVFVKETSPPPNAILLQVITQPYHIVVVPKVNGSVVFVNE